MNISEVAKPDIAEHHALINCIDTVIEYDFEFIVPFMDKYSFPSDDDMDYYLVDKNDFCQLVQNLLKDLQFWFRTGAISDDLIRYVKKVCDMNELKNSLQGIK